MRRALLLLLLAAGAQAADPVALPFKDALQKARDGHVNVAAALDRLAASEAEAGEASSILFPQLSATASQMRSTRNLEAQGLKLPGQDPMIGPFNSFDARLRLTQTLYDPAVSRRAQAAQAGARLSAAELAKARQDAMIVVAGLYIEAARAAQRRALFADLLARDQILYEAAKTQQESGTGIAVQVEQTRSTLDATQSQENAVLARARQKSIDLAQALNLNPEAEFIFDDEIFLDRLDVSSAAALEHHPDVAAARARVAVQKAQEAAVSGDSYPKVSALADAGPSGKTPAESHGTYDYGAQASIPLFQGGRRSARLKAAQARRRESQTRLADVENRLRARFLSAQTAADYAQKDLDVQRRKEAVAQKENDLAQSRWRQGVASKQEVTLARARLAQVRDDAGDALYRLRWARAAVVDSLGNIDSLLEEQP
jgi:outer membrane protein